MNEDKSAEQTLAVYLYRRLEYLQRCNAEIETKLDDEEMMICRKIDDGKYSQNDPAISQMFFHLDCVVGNTFRYTMLVGVCSFLEEAMKAISIFVLQDYESQIKNQKRGNWLRKHIQALSESVGFDSSPVQSDLDRFHDFLVLRNCIVHSWGKVANARDPDAVTRAASRLESCEILDDGNLLFGDQAVPEAIIAAENIAEHILITKLNASMT